MTTDPSILLQALRANDGLMVALALCIGPVLVLAIIGCLMRRSGASLRPLIFIGGLMMPIVTTFLVAQLVLARAPAQATSSTLLRVEDGTFTDREKLFGTDIAPGMIRDAKGGLPGILDEAVVAKIGITMNGDTVLIAQFPGPEQTKRASMAYHRSFQLHNTFGDEAMGWRATRMQGDFIEMLRTDCQLFVWTGLTKEAASARRAASRLESQFPSFISAPRAPFIPALQPLAAFFTPLPTKLCGIIFLIGVYIVWFFKGATWASSSPPPAGAPIATASELTSRLLAINQSDTPFTLVKGNSPQEFIADWRYADAKWINLARVHGMKRTFRIRLTLDESSHSVRATDYVASFDWSAGGHSASIEWQAATGIIFFQREQHRALGLQIDERGRPSPSLGHQLKFDLNELKAPIINAVTKAGWSWRPTVWQCPSWLRRLTSTPKLSP